MESDDPIYDAFMAGAPSGRKKAFIDAVVKEARKKSRKAPK